MAKTKFIFHLTTYDNIIYLIILFEISRYSFIRFFKIHLRKFENNRLDLKTIDTNLIKVNIKLNLKDK